MKKVENINLVLKKAIEQANIEGKDGKKKLRHLLLPIAAG